MPVKTPRQLVIDANIASAAGEKGSGDSKACRDFLEEVRKVGHFLCVQSTRQVWMASPCMLRRAIRACLR